MHAGLVEWREWGEEAFAEAKRLDRIILLDISAVWCHWCHVMDKTSYSDPEVAGIINGKFVPVRVDTDRMPDVNERYNMGGWPTTAFLTPGGDVLAGATYVPPDKLKENLLGLTEFFENNREELDERIEEFRTAKRQQLEQAPATPGGLTESVTRFVLGQIEGSYDAEYGGLGTEPKFPVPEAVDLLLSAGRDTGDGRYLDMAGKTLRGMAGFGMFDHVMGGFFRYSVTRDWSVPHFEKMSESNAELVVSYLEAYRLTKDEAFLETVRRTLDYVDEWLWDPKGCFRGSQDADEEYYTLPLEERLKRESPYVDTTVYANFNAKMAFAYMTAWEALGEDRLLERALSAIDFVLANMREDGGLYHFHDGTPNRYGLLTDHVAVLRTLLLACQLTSDRKRLDQALELLGFMDRALWDNKGGGYFDLPHDPDALGNLAYRTKPFIDNASAARCLKTLSVLTGDISYEQKAESCLVAHLHDYEEYGYMASGYAISAGFLLMPVTELVIVGGKGAVDTEVLWKAALSCYVPRRVLRVLYRGADDAEISKRGYAESGGAAAYICRGSTCSARITEPESLVMELEKN